MRFPKISFRSIPVLAAFALFTLVGSAKAVDVNGERVRRGSNAERLLKMSPVMRPKIAAVLSDLESHGDRPLIDAGVFRTPAEQLAKVRAGHSTVRFSFHNATTASGRADSLAADITDTRLGWNAGNAANPFWLRLAASAESHNLTTGIYWGLSTSNRNRIHAAIRTRNWGATIVRGWDAAHTEPVGVTLGQAQRGARPFGGVRPR